jgi:hypothetical protein
MLFLRPWQHAAGECAESLPLQMDLSCAALVLLLLLFAVQVLTIGATNLAQELDQALLRPGRFEVRRARGIVCLCCYLGPQPSQRALDYFMLYTRSMLKVSLRASRCPTTMHAGHASNCCA